MKILARKLGLDGNPLRLVTCDDCRTVYQPIDLTSEVLSSHYEYMGHADENTILTPLLERRLRRNLGRLTQIKRSTSSPRPAVLDVGCGGGLFLRVAERLGWEPFATEISPSCAAILQPWLGAHLHRGELPDAPFEAGSFDLIVMAEVIEHLPQPSAYLRAAHRLLAPGGTLFLTTPNYDGLSHRIWGNDWRVVADEHLNYFDCQSVRRILASTGFPLPDVRTTNFDLSMLGPLRTLVRRTPRKPESETKASTGAPRERQVGLHDLHALVVDQGMELFNRFLNRLGVGDNLKIIAHKDDGVRSNGVPAA
jgi:SAM-dependent methyltransferase